MAVVQTSEMRAARVASVSSQTPPQVLCD